MKIYNFYNPKPCKCTDDMKSRNKCCESCNLTQRRSCHHNCGKIPKESYPVYTI